MAAVKDILLVGFGAVGAIYARILTSTGRAHVTVVARSNYDIVTAEGMHFRSRKYGDVRGWRPARLVPSVAAALDRSYAYVFVTTKAVPEITRTSQLLAPLLSAPYADTHAQPAYVLLQNGLNVERDLYDALVKLGKGDPQIISAAVWIGTNLAEANVVDHSSDFDRVVLGMYRPNDFTTMTNTPAEATLLSGIADILEAGGSTVRVVPEIQRIKFTKNFWNLAFSSFATLTGYPLPALFRAPPSDPAAPYDPYVAPVTRELIETYTLPALRATLLELLALARALGFPDSEDGVPASVVDHTIDNTAMLHRSPTSVHRPSMLLDAERGLPIEVEVIVGEVVRMAKERNVDIPRIEMLYALLLVTQNQILRKLGK